MVGQVASSGLAFCFALVVGHAFHASGTGLFFEGVAIFMIASTVTSLGADMGLTRLVPRYRVTGRIADVRVVLRAAVAPPVVASSTAAVMLVIFAPDVARLVVHGAGSNLAAHYVKTLAPFVPLMALSLVLFGGTRAFDTMLPLVAMQNIGVPLLRLALLGIFLGFGLGAESVPYAYGVPVVLGAGSAVVALSFLLDRLERSWLTDSSEVRHSLQIVAEFWRFSAPRGLAASCNIVILWLDVILVGALVSARQAGVYAIASRYLAITTYAMGALGLAIAPQISRLHSGGRLGEAERVYRAGTSWLMAVSWPIALVMAVFSAALMRLFGAEFVIGASALTILALAMLVGSGTGSNGIVLVMTGRSTLALWIAVGSTILNVGLNLLLVPKIGIDGAAWAWAATIVATNLVTSIVLFTVARLHPFGAGFVRVAFASGLCFGLVGVMTRLVLGPTLPAMVVATALGAALYATLLWITRDSLDLRAFRLRRELA